MATPREVSSQAVADPEGVTGQLCNWIHSINLQDVPQEFRTRAKYLILDGLACAIVGAHLPWSETAANAVFEMEPPGDCSVFGWNKVSKEDPPQQHNLYTHALPAYQSSCSCTPQQHFHSRLRA